MKDFVIMCSFDDSDILYSEIFGHEFVVFKYDFMIMNVRFHLRRLNSHNLTLYDSQNMDSKYLADSGEARGCSTNSLVIN